MKPSLYSFAPAIIPIKSILNKLNPLLARKPVFYSMNVLFFMLMSALWNGDNLPPRESYSGAIEEVTDTNMEANHCDAGVIGQGTSNGDGDGSCPYPSNFQIFKIDETAALFGVKTQYIYLTVTGEVCCGDMLFNPKDGEGCYQGTVPGPRCHPSGNNCDGVCRITDARLWDGVCTPPLTCDGAGQTISVGNATIIFHGWEQDGNESYWYYEITSGSGQGETISHIAFGLIDCDDCCVPSAKCNLSDITVECDNVPARETEISNVFSNVVTCGVATMTFMEVRTDGSCPEEYTLTRTYKLFDDGELVAECVQVIEVLDTTPPEIICPDDKTFSCEETIVFGQATATDNCDPSPKISFKDVETAGSCPQEKTIVRTWTATDACGNSSSCDQTITVVDETAPEITCPDDKTFSCEETIVFGQATATDNCDPSPKISFKDVETAGSCPQEKTIVRTWTATDACGNSSSCDQTITVVDETAPEITCPDDKTFSCEETIVFGQATATDNCDPSPKISFKDVETAGSCPQEKTIVRTWTATDACGNSSSCDQTITVVDETAPEITCPDDKTFSCEETIVFGQATATDNCDPSPKISFKDVETAGSCPQEKTIVRTWTATDACGNSSSCDQTITVVDETAPEITCPDDKTFSCEETIVFGQATATDNCDPSPKISFKDVETAGSCPQEKTIVRTWTATDACGNSSSCDQTITVVDETAPEITCPDDKTFSCEETIVFGQATATDNCDPSPKISFKDVETAGSCPQEKTIVRTWTATDACGNSSSCDQTITVVDETAPEITCPDDKTFSCEETIVFGQATATDNCDPSPKISFKDVETAGSCPQEKTIVRTWTATDACGNSSSCDQTITVVDETAPEITCPDDKTFSCEETIVFGQATATDNCDPSPKISFKDVETAGSCPQEKTIVRTWTATDACGNSSSCDQTITVVDETAPEITCPDDKTFSCEETIVFGQATATDNCDPSPKISFKDVETAGSCPQEKTIVRTWTATDACGNSSSCDQTITVVDETAPEITCPDDKTFSCEETIVFGQATATDNCDPSPKISFKDVETAGSCPQEKTIVRTWTATDACGNSSSCDQTITVVDETAPEITCPDDKTFSCEETIVFGQATATDNCDPSPKISFKDVETAGSCPQEKTIVRTWTATDACGNSSSCDQTITVVDETAPEITCPDDKTFSCEETIVFGQATATDNCDPSPKISFKDVETAGSCPQEKTIVRTWTATDACGNSSSCDQTITVVDETAPEITCPDDKTFSCEETIVFGQATATDNCDPSPKISFKDVETAGSCPQEKTIVRTWTATDACGNSSSCDQTITVVDETAPEITCPDDKTFSCEETIVFGQATATDNCDPSPKISFKDVETAGSCPQEKTIVRTWTATDACGNSSSCDQTITVVDETAPEITCPDDKTFSCEETIVFGQATATDNCDPSPKISFKDVETAGSCPQEKTIVRTWTATDACGNSSSCDQTITVVDETAPEITCPDDKTFSCEETIVFGQATATDNCDPSPKISFKDVETAGSCPQEKTIVRTWTATDACGNSSSCDQTITVVDETAPEITCPDDKTFSCEETIVFGQATATDNCDPSPKISFKDVETAGSCPQEKTIVRTWTATDACGNSSSCDQTITVVDETAPEITCPDDKTFSCEETIVFGQATATDNCDPSPKISFKDVETAGSCPQEKTIVRTWTATDACGNSSSCDQTITVVDETAPEITCPDDKTFSCEETIVFGQATATDNCDPSPKISFKDVETAGSCPQEKTIVRTWTATDACGNSSSCDQTITVVDETAPEITCPDDKTFSCEETIVFGQATATDNCDPSPKISFKDVETAGSCPQEKTIVRTWTATDACGNSSSCDQTITVVDETAPEITCPDDKTFSCEETIVFGQATATDNCDPSPKISFKDVETAGSCPQEKTIVRTWTATDACGNSSSCDQTITVVDETAPEITCPDDKTFSCEETIVFGQATATDNCDPSPKISFKDVETAGSCPQEKTIVRTWTATDACGNSSSCDQTITVVDETAPEITCPDDKTFSCEETIVFGQATATDNCDPSPKISFKDVETAGSCPQEKTIVRTWTATDACGNSSSCDQTITVVDETAPEITCPDDKTFSCEETIVFGQATATDNCDPSPKISFKDVETAGSCPQEKTIVRTWTATDACGNSSSCDQTITVVDETAPEITCPDDKTFSCEETIVFGQATATDNCDPSPKISFKDVETAGSCPQEKTIVRTWTATDACGNSSSCDQTITVVDETAPEITCPDDKTFSCEETIVFGQATATDNCDPSPKISFKDVETAGSCPQEKTIVRTWTATDACGNSSSCDQTITVVDETAPEITCPDDKT